jgi:hypothetical protein
MHTRDEAPLAESTFTYSRRRVLVAPTWGVLQEHGMGVIRIQFDMTGSPREQSPRTPFLDRETKRPITSYLPIKHPLHLSAVCDRGSHDLGTAGVIDWPIVGA